MLICVQKLTLFYFTVTRHFFISFPVFTVITALPFPLAVTFPLEVTTATFRFDVVYVSFAVTPAGARTGFSVKLFPFFKVFAAGIPVIAVGTAFFTVTVMVTDFLPDFAVILAVPGVFATIIPSLVTAATCRFEEVKASFSSDVIGFTVRSSFFVSPVTSEHFFTEEVIPVVFTIVFCTLTVIFPVFPLASFTVILAVPVFVPAVMVQVQFFFPFTLTIFVLLDFQDFTESPLAMAATFTFVVFCLVRREMEEAFSFRTLVRAFPEVRSSVFLQTLQVLCCSAGANTVASEVVVHLLQVWPVAAIVVWAFSTFPQVEQWLPSVFPTISQVAFTPASLTDV